MGAQEVTVELLDRPLTSDDLGIISARMFDYMTTQGTEGHPLFPYVSQAGMFRWLQQLNEEGRLEAYAQGEVVVGILAYHVTALPWTNHNCLQELFIFTVDHRFCGFGRIALERLNELAVEHDCSFIATGSFINFDPAMTRNLYMKKGKFNFSYPAFIKLVD